ncbi:MAG: hypothetical protein WCX86_07740 [Candidatus Hydrogenedentales bacterium]|jgi:hypothetical protein
MQSEYRYHGYLSQLTERPDPEALKQLNQVVFPSDSLERWKLEDYPSGQDWKSVYAQTTMAKNCVQLHGQFGSAPGIDNVNRKPHFWAPLSVTSEEDPRFPLDCSQFPIVEITYRCTTPYALAACHWQYAGGDHLVSLGHPRNWTTAAIPLQHHNFPKSISRFTLRLYGLSPNNAILEIAEVRFRSLLPEEERLLHEFYLELEQAKATPHYPLLDEFLPMGVHMNIPTVDQLAEMLDISFFDYLRLAFEDIVRHHHNSVVLEEMQLLSPEQRHVVVELAENFGLRLVPCLNWPMEQYAAIGGETAIEEFIKPYVNSSGILAWNLSDSPKEEHLKDYIDARDKIAEVDPNHPVVIHNHRADTHPLFAPHFAVSGFSNFSATDPRSLSQTIDKHLPFLGGQQFWLTAPAFKHISGSPNWSSSPQLRLMLNTTLAHGGRGWFSHCYHNTPVWVSGDYERSLTGPFLTFSDLWSELGNRIERLAGLAPLFLSAYPVPQPVHIPVCLEHSRSPKTQLDQSIEPVSISWLQGPDFFLFYVINNDANQATSVHFSLPDYLPDDEAVYEVTALVRNRAWEPSPNKLRFEMFPGQSRLFMVARPPVCNHWREVIARRMLESDRRQAQVDLELARQYRLNLYEIEDALNTQEEHASIQELNRVRVAREQLYNLIHTTPEISKAHSLLVQASSIVAGCDEALAALCAKHDTARVRELSVKALPLARTLTALRLQLRRGHGQRIAPDIAALVQSGSVLLSEIWGRYRPGSSIK